MDQLCPPESSKVSKKLCVLLISTGKTVSNEPEEEAKRSHLRHFITSHPDLNLDRIKFAYILKDIQSDFVNALAPKNDLNMAILWRREGKKLKYEWFDKNWPSTQNNQTQEALKATLEKLLSPNEILNHETVLNELLDEHAASLPMRILQRFLDFWDFIKDHTSKEEVLPVISLIAAVLFVFIGAQCMQMVVGLDDENEPGQRSNITQRPPPELRLVEFKAETFNGLVRLLRPGCRTLILICDIDTKNVLVPKFFKLMWPYRRNKTLNFGYMFIEKGLNWFHQLLEQTSEDAIQERPKIKAKNCVGTVLALNGHRRYYNMYHARNSQKSQRTSGKNSISLQFQGSYSFRFHLFRLIYWV